MSQTDTLLAVPRMRRPPEGRRLPRINVEVYPEDEELIARARAAASLERETLRDLVMRALAGEVRRLERRRSRGAHRQ